MAAPTTPRHKRLAVVDEHGIRSSSTPPANRINPHLLAPSVISPSSRHSSPGIDRLWNGRHYADDMIPRRLTASPVANRSSKDRTRKRLTEYHSIDHAVELLKNAKNIVVLTGAGISTSLDIPDFRSAEGFYSKLSSSIGLTTPEEFFSLDFFKKESESFWDNVKPLMPKHVLSKDAKFQYIAPSTSNKTNSIPRFSKTHAFLSLLYNKGKLLTNYTQNIDNLEYASGVNAEKIIKCHGSWDTATCLSCKKTISARKYLPVVWENGYPRCSCAGKDVKASKPKSKPKKRKRAIYEGDSDHDSDDGTKTPAGLFKPDITFFGEDIPDYYVPRLEEDKVQADLLLVIGTSLKTRPVKTMVVDFPPHIPQIWINKDRFSGWLCDMPGVQFDIELLGECDIVVEELCRRAGYPLQQYLWTSDRPQEKVKDLQTPQIKTGMQKDSQRTDEEQENSQVANNLALRDRKNHVVNGLSSSGQNESSFEAEENISDVKAPSRSVEQLDNRAAGLTLLDVRVEADLDAEWRWRFTKRAKTPTVLK